MKTGETVEQANMREIIEETGVHMSNVRKIGLILFTFACAPELFLEVHLFDTDSSFEKITLNDEYEGLPVWFPFGSIPFEVIFAISIDSFFLSFFLFRRVLRSSYRRIGSS